MRTHNIRYSVASDEFQELIGDPRLYQSTEHLAARIDAYTTKLNDPRLSREGKLGIELGLLWIGFVRGTGNGERELQALETIEPQIPAENEILKLEYHVVRATYLILIRNEYEQARDILERAAGALKESAHNMLYAISARALSNVYIMTGRMELAEEYVQDSISIFRRHANKLLLASSLNSYAVLKKMCCQYDEAQRLLRQAMSIFESIGAADGEFLCLNNLAIIKIKTGEWAEADTLFERLQALETRLNLKSDNLMIYKVNLAHLHLLKRNYSQAEALFHELAGDSGCAKALRQKALSHEFLGELYTETGDYKSARSHLDQAVAIALDIAPEGDLMTEALRRTAQLLAAEGDLCEAHGAARQCIRLSKKIEDKHELGAALRILGDIHAAGGRTKKAASAYEESIRLLRGAKESYELMRSCISMASLLIGTQKESAGVYLLEAKHLASKMELEYFTARILMLLGTHALSMGNHREARVYLRKAQMICGAMNGADKTKNNDKHKIESEVAGAYRELDKAIVISSISSAEKLKILGKIYEEARFPVEEAGPRMATEVARNVNAESLFVARKRNGGYRIPLKYNISSDKAKRIVRRLDNGGGKRVFGAKQPRICDIGSGKKLLSISGRNDEHCALCMIIDGDCSLSQQDMEFLLASYEAMERVAGEQAERSGRGESNAFGDGPFAHPGCSFSSIITVDSHMIRLLNLAERAGQTDVPILLQGETGVGKELFTRAIHDSSSRREKACIAINTGGIPLHFIESELFGYVKGAFTDARMDKPGLVEHARGGTLFLDEIGDMSDELQVKLLRLIENGEYRRLGEAALRHADVRIISATNKDLTDLVERGKFREDLFYRLSTVRFTIPALRYRRGDIGLLVRHLLKFSLEKLQMPGRRVEIDAKAMEAFELYDWPGNIRELQNEIMRLVSLLGCENVIRFHMLSDAIQRYFKSYDGAGLHEERIEQYERRLIIQALEANDWNRLKAAEEMGIPRTTLLAKMRRLNITS